MPNLLYQFIDHWIVDGFSIQDVRDILLEFLAVIGAIVLLVVIIVAMIKAPMLLGHGSIEMSIFSVFVLVHVVMNILDEFIWFTSEFYPIWKILKDTSLLIGAIVMMVGFFRFFIFSARLFGTEPMKEKEDDDDDDDEDDDILREAVEEVAEAIDEADEGFTEDEIIEEVIVKMLMTTLSKILLKKSQKKLL
ncbi:MAG: hypothetical protein ACTSR1_11990 [Candidatus Heimdallarchaeota archaeon]